MLIYSSCFNHNKTIDRIDLKEKGNLLLLCVDRYRPVAVTRRLQKCCLQKRVYMKGKGYLRFLVDLQHPKRRHIIKDDSSMHQSSEKRQRRGWPETATEFRNKYKIINQKIKDCKPVHIHSWVQKIKLFTVNKVRCWNRVSKKDRSGWGRMSRMTRYKNRIQ